MKVATKNILLVLLTILILIVAGETSFRPILEVCTILSDKETVIVKHSRCVFKTGEGRSARPGNFELSFDFTVNDSNYYISNNKYEPYYYHYSKLWNDRVGFGHHEKFEVTYYKKDPYRCIPTKCIRETLFNQGWGALSVIFIGALFLFAGIRYLKKKRANDILRKNNR